MGALDALGGNALGGSALGGNALCGSTLGGSALGGNALGGNALGGFPFGGNAVLTDFGPYLAQSVSPKARRGGRRSRSPDDKKGEVLSSEEKIRRKKGGRTDGRMDRQKDKKDEVLSS